MSVSSSRRAMKPISDRFILAVTLAVGAYVSAVFAANALLIAGQYSPRSVLVEYDAAAGILSIVLTWKLLRWTRERNQLLRERDCMILALNHEVRNAIQVISLADYRDRGTVTSQVKVSIDRIERALDEYVPNKHAAMLVSARPRPASAFHLRPHWLRLR